MTKFDLSKIIFGMDSEDLRRDLEAPVDIFKRSLYLRKVKNQGIRVCAFKNVKIKLSTRLFDALFLMAENPYKSHKLVTSYGENCAEPETERKIVQRIREAFEKEGFSRDIIVKIKGSEGYRINTAIIQENLVITGKK